MFLPYNWEQFWFITYIFLSEKNLPRKQLYKSVIGIYDYISLDFFFWCYALWVDMRGRT